MKKVMLILMLGVFTLGSSSFKNSEKLDEFDDQVVSSTCFDQADGMATLGGILFGWSHEQENDFFDTLLDACLEEYPNGVVPR